MVENQKSQQTSGDNTKKDDTKQSSDSGTQTTITAEASGNGKVTTDEFPAWEALTAHAADFGEKKDSGRGFYSSLTDSNMTDFMKDHTDRFFSVISGPDSKGNFGFLRVEGVWETWTITKDRLASCDQWMFLVTRDGAVAQVYHKLLVEDENRRVMKHEEVEFTQEQGLKKWVEFKTFWYNKLKKDNKKKNKFTSTFATFHQLLIDI